MPPDEEALVDLDIAIQGAIESFVDDFRVFWGLEGNEPPEGLEWEEWYELLSLDAAAQHLVAASLRLYKPDGLRNSDVNWPAQLAEAAEAEHRSREELLERVRALGNDEQDWPAIESYLRRLLPDHEGFRQRFFHSAVQNHLANSFFPSVHSMAQNLVTLVGHLMREDDPQVGRYLQRVARCYLLDMAPELALMSRAVLEAALEKRLPADYMRAVRGISSARRVPLEIWIDEAAASGLLNQVQEDAATRLKKVGGQVAHGRALDDMDPDRILEDLHTVVLALSQRSA